MSDEMFDGKILHDKLSKLNNSQQSIESLSSWCVSHRKKAKQIVESWDKLFNNSQRERRISFLYLANDILQNSRRKGSEFVNEFWKVLPSALKHVYENGDENGKKAVSRLVGIWEERKVFGSRGRSLKDEMLGADPPPLLMNTVNTGKSPNPIKIVKKDANSLRIKLAVGGIPEKIVTALQSVHDELLVEETSLNKCEAAIHRVKTLEKDVDSISPHENQQASEFLNELLEQENVLEQCVGQLEIAEAARMALVSHLKEALQDQESNLELIRDQLQVARDHIQQAAHTRQMLTSPPIPSPPATTNMPSTVELTTISAPQPPMLQTTISFAPSKTSEEESTKATIAAVADKLTASASSAQIMSSVLSSLVAQDFIKSGLHPTTFPGNLPFYPPEKRPKLEKPMSISDTDTGPPPNFSPIRQQQTVPSMPFAPPATVQTPFPPLPPPPPPPLPPGNPPANQFVGLMVPYSYGGGGGGGGLPPPPPLPSHIIMGLSRPPQLPPPTRGFFRPPGNGFYAQNHHPTTPAAPRP